MRINLLTIGFFILLLQILGLILVVLLLALFRLLLLLAKVFLGGWLRIEVVEGGKVLFGLHFSNQI